MHEIVRSNHHAFEMKAFYFVAPATGMKVAPMLGGEKKPGQTRFFIKRHEDKTTGAAPRENLSQTSDVIGHRLDFTVVEFGRHLRHGKVVGSDAIAERG